MPSQIETKKEISVLIYGEPGIGKTTLACSAPAPVLFDFDGGVQRINGAHRVPTVQVRSWDEAVQALDEIERDLPETQSIIIDTVGKMLDFMSLAIIKSGERGMVNKDGTLSLKGYGVRKNMFIEFNKRVMHIGKSVFYVAHEREEKRGEDVVKRPEIGGSSANDLIKELDLVGYMRAIGKERTITFDPCELWYAKNTCNLPATMKISAIVDERGAATGENVFLQQILKAYATVQERNSEQTGEYEKLMDDIRGRVKGIRDAADANAVATYIGGIKHIFNSKIVARNLFSARVKELGLCYDAETKSYADGVDFSDQKERA